MTTRTIKILADGRTFRGDPLAILAEMKNFSFVVEDSAPISEYMQWLEKRIEMETGGRFVPSGVGEGSDAERAERIIDAMIENGLALEVL